MPETRAENETGRADTPLAGHTVLVAGGAGNVGRHIVRALLEQGSRVVVPSRSRTRLDALRNAIGTGGEGLVTLVGDVTDERDAARVREEASTRLPSPLDAVVASLGHWVSTPSLLTATRSELVETLENYVIGHFVVARTFLPMLAARGGSYTLINGPSAFDTWPGSALVSIATAAQAMLARALAAEEAVRDRVRVTELVIHPSAWIGPAADGGAGPIDGPAVGQFVAALVAGRVNGGTTVHLESADQITALT